MGYVKVSADSYKDGKGYGLTSEDYKINSDGCLPKAANPIKIDLPDGFYDMTIYRKGGGHADVYSNDKLIVQNSSAASDHNRAGKPAVLYAPRIKIEGGNANIYTEEGRNSEKIASIKITRVPDYARKPVIWVAGDSESADYYPYSNNDLKSNNIMRTGIGTQLRKLLPEDRYSVANFAQQSYTAENWVNECLEPFNYFVQKDDTIIINFGMNDIKKSNLEIAKTNMAKIISVAKKAEAKAVLVSPIYAKSRVPLFNYDTQTGKNEMETFAKEQGVPFIDLNRYTYEYIKKATEDTGDKDWISHNYNIIDELHLTQHSALLAADFIAAGLKKLGYATTDFAYEYKDIANVNTTQVSAATEKEPDKIKETKPVRGTETGVKRTYSITAVEDMVEPYIPSSEPIPTQGALLYSEDFEKYKVGNGANWKSSYGSVEVCEDKKGKYLRKASNGNSSSRSSYVELPQKIDKNFVFEADLKLESNNNVSSFEIVETPKSIYTNHGVYSNEQYAFKIARPKSSDVYVVNNTRSDSNLTLADYNQPAVVTDAIGDAWVHIKIVGDFDKKTTIAYITSLDGAIEYYHGMTDMSEKMSGFKCLMLMSSSDTKYSCIDNIEIREATAYDLSPKYYKVKISDFGNSFEQYVFDGENVVNIPSDVEQAYGASFEGWEIGNKLYSKEQLAKLPITEDCEIVSKVSDSYIEPLQSVEFSGLPAGNELTMGADGNTFADNIISLKIIGARGTSLVLNPNKKVKDYKIEWSFDGFRTLDGKPTNETGSFYCDSYGFAEINEEAQASVNFKLKNTAANYYGKVTAQVTYNGKTIIVSNPLVILGDKSGNTILPRGGYISDFSKYENTMVGTEITDANSTAFDGWSISSGYKANSRYAFLEYEKNKKFIRFKRTENASSGASYLCNNVGEIREQTLFEQDVRFNISEADIYYTDTNKDLNGNEAFKLNFDGKEIKINGVKVTAAERNTWYNIKLSVSPYTKNISCMIYDDSGTKLLGAADVPYIGDMTSQKYYVLKPAEVASSSVDINNVIVRDTKVNDDTFIITSEETAKIPSNGNATINLSTLAQTTDGFKATDKAVWSIDGAVDGISIVANDDNSHNAVIKITSQAASGDLSVRCTIDGVSTIKKIKLIGDKDNVAFTTASMGVMIPLSGKIQKEYKAIVRNGQGNAIENKTVRYEIGSESDGVSIDSETGIITVTSEAKPQTIIVTAKSTDTNGLQISKSINIRLYNLKFSFGNDRQGYTTIYKDDLYSDLLGFGITGTAENDADALSGTGFGFNIKLERGKVYRVKVDYTGEIVYEKKDNYMTGIIPTDTKLGKNQPYMDIALFGDDILDIALTGAGTIKTIEITPVDKIKQKRPDWWTIGDSTVAQSGSWASTLGEEGDIEKYTDFIGPVINAFHNSGSAGRQHKSFYNAGWFNNILVNMNPGDIVSISGMGTNDSTSTKELFEQFNNFYIDAIKDMGGYVVLGSYTPTGNYGDTAGKVYDSDNMIFKGRRTYVYEKAIRDVYEKRKNESEVIAFVDIGKINRK